MDTLAADRPIPFRFVPRPATVDPTHRQSPISSSTGPSDVSFSRVGAAAAVIGLVVYFVSVVLHPGTPPHETATAFAQYAQEPYWGVIHLAELLGVLSMSAAGLALSWRLRRGRAGVWAVLGGAAMILFAAVYAVFAAVDGVAIGVLVRRLAAEPDNQRILFEAAYAVRQIEAGLFALQWFMFGIAAALYAPAFLQSELRGRWSAAMASLSALASVGTLSFGVVQTQEGFTVTSMNFQVGLYLGVLWLVGVGLFLHRSPGDDDASRFAGPGAGAGIVGSGERDS